jgi:hypothetical protein
MNYSSFYYHLNPMIHYLFAFCLLFIILPKWLIASRFQGFGERMLNGYVSIVLLFILSGYLLVVTKLYEVISIVIMFCLIVAIKRWRKSRNEQQPTMSYLIKYLFDRIDGLHFTNRLIVQRWFSVKFVLLKTILKEKYSFQLAFEISLFLFIISIASYIRFYDVFHNAAPPLADSYVTLAWMKYIDAREIFHDGIYPQGFHIYLATLLKFSSIDGLLVLRYTGPFNTILITICLYYVIRKLTGNSVGALVASSIYGCHLAYINWFPIERQVGTNSQEFAFVFIYPVVYFLINYCLTKKKEYLQSGIYSTAIIGLVHSLAFAYIGLLIGILILCTIIATKTISKSVITLAGYSLFTVLLAVLPMLLGLLLGKDFHSTSVDYLLSNNSKLGSPTLVAIDYVTLVCLSITIILLLLKKMTIKDRFIGLFTILAGLITFAVYYIGGPFTNSVLVASRSSELWGIIVPFTVGITCSLLFKYLFGRWTITAYLLFLGYFCVMLYFFKPTPIIAYKLEHNSNLEQYLRISSQYRPKTWQLVSHNEGYAVSLGTGYHMHMDDFTKQFDPEKEALTKIGESKPDPNLAPEIFILLEKKMFKVSVGNSIYSILEPEYKQRQLNYQKMQKWLDIHQTTGHDMDIYYEDNDITIYHLKVKTAKQKQKKAIWNDW